ncbi:unnamed protein product (macronuclear) [Paramecium tetraurelia]|uniref:Ion transport domain-containing protein n=1 Tax=Paramecium tetraurelia TaxID=5888 RepID=A0DB70_PARTE|nr:uncharacterized protein GSPATT00015181001 [Paramecium tetraurelia]CAK80287.1 unnamed protein product [Paramecium tetraurelia]|eukprot:XP_001447684.1 hypothetical protein (macronuclear) [Paramecium tetraurelia strain d4-2]
MRPYRKSDLERIVDQINLRGFQRGNYLVQGKREQKTQNNYITSLKEIQLTQNQNESYCEGIDEEVNINRSVLNFELIDAIELESRIGRKQEQSKVYRSFEGLINDEQNTSLYHRYNQKSQENIRDHQTEYVKSQGQQEILNEYHVRSRRNVYEDNYNLRLINSQGIEAILNNFHNYFDSYPLLKLRKYIVLLLELLSQICEMIISSRVYRYVMLFIITTNIILLITKYYGNFYEQYQEFFDTQQEVFFIIYVLEICIRVSGHNIVNFFCQFWNIFDLINVVILGLVTYGLISFDFSPLRAIRVLIFLSQLSSQLQLTFKALIQSLRYMLEALLIVLIFCVLFANIGLHQFATAFYNKCVYLEEGLILSDQYCGWLDCPIYSTCINVPIIFAPDPITNFNNFINSFISIIRIITMDNWTDLMYPTLYTQSPLTWIYFVFVIFIVGFFAFNLIIAILKTYYSHIVANYSQDQEDVRKEQDDQIEINLRFIKDLGLYQKLKVLQRAKLHTQQQSQDSSQSQIINNYTMKQPFLHQQGGNSSILSPQISARIVAKSTAKKIQRFAKSQIEKTQKKKQYAHVLSARQRREMEELNDEKKTNFIGKIKSSCKLRYIILPKRSLILEQTFQFQNSNEEEMDILHQLQTHDVLGWKVSVVYKDYVSNSQSEVLGQKQEYLLKEKKLVTELQKIRSKKIHQFYFDDEILKQYQNTCNKMIRSSILPINKTKRKIQVQSQTFEELRNDEIEILSPKRQSSKSSSVERKFRSQRKTMLTIKKQRSDFFFEFPEYQEGEPFIFLNGVKRNYESVSILINRTLENEQEIPDTEDLNSLFFQYLKYRRLEIKNNVIFKQNISLLDVIKNKKLSLLSIFRSLNSKEIHIWMIGFTGLWKSFQLKIKMWLNNSFINLVFDFSNLLSFCVLCSIGFLDDELIEQINLYMTFQLIVQISLKLISQGIILFGQEGENILDSMVIITQIIYIIIISTEIPQKDNYASEIKALRATNAILLYRIIKYNQFVTRIMRIAKITFKKYLSLMFLMLSIILIFSILGMQFFIENFQENESLSQLHSFKSFAKSWMTIFNISTNDDAVGMLKVVIKFQQPWIGILFYFITVFTINYLIYGLVMAVLLDAFSSELERVVEKQQDQSLILARKVGIQENIQFDSQNNNITQNEEEQYLIFVIFRVKEQSTQPTKSHSSKHHAKINIRDLPETSQKLFIKKRKRYQLIYYEDTKCADSCFIFSYNNRFRKICYRISKSLPFKLLNDVTIIISVVFQILSDFQLSNNQQLFDSSLNQYFEVILLIQNIVILAIFIVEIIAKGFILNEGTILRDFWKLVNMTYTTAYFLSFISSAPILKQAHHLIFCRPLMMVNMFGSVQGVKNAMVKSLIQIINIVAVILFVFMVFNVFAMHLYQKKMGYCEDLMNFHISYSECQKQNKQWINHPYNFDNFVNGLFTLTMISSLDAWGEIMQVCYNASNSSTGPSPFKIQWATYLLFVTFIFIGAMFFMGFLTGVLFTEFQKFTKKIENKNLTQDQSQFIQICSIVLNQKPGYSHAPHSTIRKLAYKLVFSKYYKYLYNCILVTNSIALCFLFDIHSQYTRNLANQLYQLHAIIFTFDCIIKIMAYGVTRYMSSRWRLFELIITVISIADFMYDLKKRWFHLFTNGSQDQFIIYIAKVFLICRDIKILLIFQEFKGLQRLMRVLFFTSSLLVKILYIQLTIQATYALVGTRLFDTYIHVQGRAIDEYYLNFRNFINAALVLFKCTTGDDWRALIIDCSRSNMYCRDDVQQCGSGWAYSYFLSYYLLSNIVVMNLFVLALVDQFESFFSTTTNVIQTFVENIDHFCNCWCRYTYDTKGLKMHTRYIGRFLLDLNQPLGAQKGDNIWDAAKDAFNFRIRADKRSYVNFNELLYETLRFAFLDKVFKDGTQAGKAEMKLFDMAMKRKLNEKMKERQKSGQTQGDIKLFDSIDGSFDFKYSYQNFNILQEYLHLLIIFKTWKSYTINIFEKSKRGLQNYTEQSSDERYEYISQFSVHTKDGLQGLNEEKLYASQAIDEQNKEEIMQNFKESNKYRLTNYNSQNSSTLQGVVYEPAGTNPTSIIRMQSTSLDPQGVSRSILKKKCQTLTLNDVLLYQNKQKQNENKLN